MSFIFNVITFYDLNHLLFGLKGTYKEQSIGSPSHSTSTSNRIFRSSTISTVVSNDNSTKTASGATKMSIIITIAIRKMETKGNCRQ